LYRSSPPNIRAARPPDVPPLASALARAFDDDPVAVWTQPNARRRPGRLRSWYAGRLRTLMGEELVFCDAERRGAALWAPPDRWRVPAGEVLRGLPQALSPRLPMLLHGMHGVERRHPERPHFYLAMLGVDPAAQGSGLGSALLAPMLERCDREHVPAYLESSKERNLDFYGRHGFVVTGEVQLPRGPRVWLMWREPR
jgi:ribosomal protein S18 acetylase RimI-like enzyme